MSKLTDSKIRWMIRRKEEGRMTNRKIARVYNITPRRLQQLWAQYRSTGQIPTLRRPGRPRKPRTRVWNVLIFTAQRRS